jgi:hypothetical protein
MRVMGDQVVRALVCAVQNLEAVWEEYELREAGNAIEDIAYHLNQMASDERQQFLDALDRLARAIQ